MRSSALPGSQGGLPSLQAWMGEASSDGGLTITPERLSWSAATGAPLRNAANAALLALLYGQTLSAKGTEVRQLPGLLYAGALLRHGRHRRSRRSSGAVSPTTVCIGRPSTQSCRTKSFN